MRRTDENNKSKRRKQREQNEQKQQTEMRDDTNYTDILLEPKNHDYDDR
jgi:hypothetical protein